MKKKLVSFMCAVMAALCLAVSVPAQAYAASEDELALQYTGISEILIEEPCNITHGHVYQVVVTAYVYNSAGKLVETQTAETNIKAY